MGKGQGRKKRNRELKKHHCYPRGKGKRKTQEVKWIPYIEHDAWHRICYNLPPKVALQKIIEQFMPEEYQYLLEELK